MKEKIRISQCMIVKNEEKNICQALSWGKSMMWEQIVVDTGSTDRTVDIAREMGAKVFFFSWIDDFAAAKNYAVEKAEGDWIAFLDADEYMMPDDVEKMQMVFAQIAEKNFDGISTGWQQLNDRGEISFSGTQVRFFKNHPDIRYRRRIHENLVSLSGRVLRFGDVVQDISIFHTGYQTQSMEKKSGRNRKLIFEELKDHPDDYEMMGYMGDDYSSSGETEEAKLWYHRSIQHMPSRLDDSDQRSAVTFTTLLSMLADGLLETGKAITKSDHENMRQEIEQVYQKAVALLPKEADFDYILGRYLVSAGDAKLGAAYLEKAIEKLEAYGCNNRALLLAANLFHVYDMLSWCYFEIGEQQKCAIYAVNYLKYDKYEMGVLARLIKLLIPETGGSTINTIEYEETLGFFLKLYDHTNLKDLLFLLKAAEGAKRQGFAAFVADRFFTKEQQVQLRLTGISEKR